MVSLLLFSTVYLHFVPYCKYFIATIRLNRKVVAVGLKLKFDIANTKYFRFYEIISAGCNLSSQECLSTYCLLMLTPWSRALLEKLILFSTSQEISHLLWNPEVHFHVHKFLQVSSLVMNPVLNFISLVFILCSNIILPYIFRSSKWSLSIRFPTKILCTILMSPTFHLSHPLWFHKRLHLSLRPM